MSLPVPAKIRSARAVPFIRSPVAEPRIRFAVVAGQSAKAASPAPGPGSVGRGGAVGPVGPAATVVVSVIVAAELPLQYAVWPVKTSAVEQPASSVTVRRTV